jgi:hypothetical protein
MLSARLPLRPPLKGEPCSMAAVTTTPEPSVTQDELEQEFSDLRKLIKPPRLHHGVNGNGHGKVITDIALARQSCVVSKIVSGTCDVCHQRCFPLHWPQYTHGFFCSQCCPAS